MDVRTGCTTRARVQQKLTQNKQVQDSRSPSEVGFRHSPFPSHFPIKLKKLPIKGSAIEQALFSQLLLKKLLGPMLFALNHQDPAVIRAEVLLCSVSDLDQLPSNYPDLVHITLHGILIYGQYLMPQECCRAA
jgi:hypothetical protein